MIYICIPALNEAPTVGVLVWKIRQVMAEFGRDYHVLLLDDGSTDDTREVLSPYVQVMPLTVLRNDRTRGYGPAVERLLQEAVSRSTHPKRDVAVVLQADFSESPDDIPALVRRMEGGADLVGGLMPARREEVPRAQRWLRRGVSWLLRGRAVPREIQDPASGFRAYRIAVLKRALGDRPGQPVLTGGGWATNVQLLLAVAPHARRADSTEVVGGITERPRPSRMQTWGTAVDLWRVTRAAPPRPRTAPVEPAPAPPPASAPAPAAEPTAATAGSAVATAPRGKRGGQRRRPPRKREQGDSA